MPVMQWSDTLVIDEGVMDDTHREFIELLNRVADAPDENLLAALDEFIRHSEEHFAQEQRWMEQMTYPPLTCHVKEHDGVLETALEVRRRVAAGETRFNESKDDRRWRIFAPNADRRFHPTRASARRAARRFRPREAPPPPSLRPPPPPSLEAQVHGQPLQTLQIVARRKHVYVRQRRLHPAGQRLV